MNAAEAAEGLQALGLSQYEAEVFVALQRLGTGTAREVADVTDVPRSQVYGAAEGLEDRGLLEIQHSQPMRYRPVSLDEARERLEERFRRRGERTFEALADVRNDREPAGEQEAVWSVAGREAVSGRVASLVGDATDRVVLSADADYLDGSVRDALADAADRGVTVVVASADPVDGLEDTGVTVRRLPADFAERSSEAGRLLVVDHDAVLVSVDPPKGEETAIWAADTALATVLIRLADTWFGSEVDL